MFDVFCPNINIGASIEIDVDANIDTETDTDNSDGGGSMNNNIDWSLWIDMKIVETTPLSESKSDIKCNVVLIQQTNLKLI